MQLSAHRFSGRLLAGLLALYFSMGVSAGQLLLLDDFNGPALNTAIWGQATWNIGDRTQFGNTPVFGAELNTNYITLPLDTWNPNLPGQRVLGTEIYTLQNFSNSGGVEYLTRARLNTSQPGLVAAFFTYNQKRQKGRTLSDEIDFEVLSNQSTGKVLVTSWNDWGAAGSDYEDGIHHLGAYVSPAGYNWQDWNDYGIRWYPDRVEWWVNGIKVRTHTAPVPDQLQPIRASLWAGGTTWPDAYSAALAPVNSQALNTRFKWDIDYIMVTRLDGGGSGSAPTAPTNLIAGVSGNSVQLAWTDTATTETGFRVYRAWKPKGKAAPDFKVIATLGTNVISHVDNPPAGQHLYRVSAFNASGESSPSNSVAVTVSSG